jgi:hypothetical protein
VRGFDELFVRRHDRRGDLRDSHSASLRCPRTARSNERRGRPTRSPRSRRPQIEFTDSSSPLRIAPRNIRLTAPFGWQHRKT